MARPVDPERHLQRRLQIIDAALTCFAASGYAGASTAAICRQAGIGSGTLFHYFPTKASIMVAILEYGTQEARERFEALADVDDPLEALTRWVDEVVDEMSDPRLAGFVNAVAAILGVPEIAAALATDEEVTTVGLTTLVERAQAAGQVRIDLAPRRLASWLALIVDGFLGRIATAADFEPLTESGMLRETVLRVLREGDAEPPPEHPGAGRW